VLPIEYHQEGCDVARCWWTGIQLLQCDYTDHGPQAHNTRWTGEWPGVEECRDYGWFVVLVPGRGWVECNPWDEGATEDLNRLISTCDWSVPDQRWVSRSSNYFLRTSIGTTVACGPDGTKPNNFDFAPVEERSRR
jgi:hypothetical protein